MHGNISKEDIHEVLSSIELREFKLLKWGIVDAAFTKDELLEIISTSLEEILTESQIVEYFDYLLSKGLILKTPNELYRSRMAETVRLLSTLRQWFPGKTSQDARPLVIDYRLEHRSRQRPRRDIKKEDAVDELVTIIRHNEVKKTLEAITPATISGFQKRSISAVLESLDSAEDRTVMITAGTGSGKTYGFYLPALAWLSQVIADSNSTQTKILCLYPRNELLKDQLRNLLQVTRRLETQGTLSRPIRVGTYFGPTPAGYNFESIKGWEPKRDGDVITGHVCPFLTCLIDGCDGELIWKKIDQEEELDRLFCNKCADQITSEFLSLTRGSSETGGVDILLATTEMLNRVMANPLEREIFGLNAEKSLRLVLLDEVHTYEGLSGAQNAFLMRRLRHVADTPLVWVGLSATLEEPDEFIERFTNTTRYQTQVVKPLSDEMEESGAEYMIALRHHPGFRTSPLSTTIQACMVMGRSLDAPFDDSSWSIPEIDSEGFVGNRSFVFSDKLDVMNRLYWGLRDAEGWANRWGKLKSRRVKSLAHLRSSDQGNVNEELREDPKSRDLEGQWWWLAEKLGHGLENDKPLTVGRTYSADTGVSDDQIIIATASLEVGYDDDRVGAVIQHKAPHDPAQFLQRKGRAGRNMDMRPWTVIVLSGFGRDRVQWQLYDQLFSPTLKRLSLPMNNRYVQRLQAVYATLDWLGSRLRGEGGKYSNNKSAWKDLAGPWSKQDERKSIDNARKYNKPRQDKIHKILDRVLQGEDERTELRNYLLNSLALGEPHLEHTHSDVEALFWSPPRSLLLSVLPTITRRIKYQWREEEPDEQRIKFRLPLPEYVPGNLFDDLLTPEVTVHVSSSRANDQYNLEILPTLRALRELMPGNVTRHYGKEQASNRHWVPIGEKRTLNIEEVYSADFVEEINTESNGEAMKLFTPRKVRLEVPPDNVNDSSSVKPDWKVLLTPIGDGEKRNFPEESWSSIIQDLSFHTHNRGDGVRIKRYATSASGFIIRNKQKEEKQIDFVDAEEEPVAIGLDINVDGLKVTFNLDRKIPEPTPLERTDWMLEVALETALFSPKVSKFDKENLVKALQLVLVEIGENSERKFNELTNEDFTARLTESLYKLEKTLVSAAATDENLREDLAVEDEETQLESYLKQEQGEDLLKHCDDVKNLEALREIAKTSWMQRNDQWLNWTKSRLATSFASFFLESIQMVCEQLDIEQLSVDLQPSLDGSNSIDIWITETVPGGNGYIELIHRNFKKDARRFADLFEFALHKTDLEKLDEQMQKVLSCLINENDVQVAAEKLSDAWNRGHVSVVEAQQNLRSVLETHEIKISKIANTTAQMRLFGPGTHSDFPTFIKDIFTAWERLENIQKFSISPEIISSQCLEKPQLDEVLHIRPGTDNARKASILAGILWPRSDVAGQIDHEVSNLFGLLPKTDPELFRTYFPPRRTPASVAIQTLDEDTGLLSEFEEQRNVRLQGNAKEASVFRKWILRSQLNAVDAGLIMAFPRLTSLEEQDHGVSVDLVLEERVEA